MAAAQARRAYDTLDGMRAIGAFLVVTRHVPDFFGGFHAPESFLAVDLFYLVSGFVIAHAYGERLKAGGFVWGFFKTRVIRLYPLYIVGLALGTLVAVMSITTDPHPFWNWPKLAVALGTGLFMIPSMPGLTAGSSLDGPVWTLLYELIANMVYAVFARFMNIATLLGIMLVSAVGLVFAEFHFGKLDVGFGATDQWAALARVGFSFFAGVLVFRFHDSRPIKAEWASWLLMAALTLMLAFRPSREVTPWYELGMIIVGFPVLLALAARFEPGALSSRAFGFLGLMSYGVYIIHQPIGHLARRTFEKVVELPDGWAALPWAVGFLAFLVAVAAALDQWWDAPVRKALRARFLAGGR
jgi:peptidoglycan/LPS O-acetylase OafA/YrhL